MYEAQSMIDGRRKPRVWLWLTVAAVLALLTLLVATGMWQARQQSQVADRIVEIESTGEPLSAEELELFYTYPPAGEDTTQLWLDAIAPFALPAFGEAVKGVPIVGDSDLKIPPPGQQWPELAKAEQLLAQYQNSLDLLHEAAAQGGAARYPTKFKDGVTMLLPHAQNLRNASRLLALEAHVKAHRGDLPGALKSIETSLAIGKSLENEPVLISQLVRLATQESARGQLLKLLSQVEFADDDLARLQEKLEAIEYRPSMHRSLLGERALGAIAFDDLGQVGAGGGKNLFWRLVRPGAKQVYLDHMQRSLWAAQQPFPEALLAAQQIQAELNADTEASAWIGRLKYQLTNMVAVSLETYFTAVARYESRNDAAATAIAIERFRRQQGRLPGDLRELAPQYRTSLPYDSFSGRPLRYVPSETGYILYNIGADGIDNGGQGDDTGKPDDVLRMEYPSGEKGP